MGRSAERARPSRRCRPGAARRRRQRRAPRHHPLSGGLGAGDGGPRRDASHFASAETSSASCIAGEAGCADPCPVPGQNSRSPADHEEPMPRILTPGAAAAVLLGGAAALTPLPSAAADYDVDCAVILCMAAGLPGRAVRDLQRRLRLHDRPHHRPAAEAALRHLHDERRLGLRRRRGGVLPPVPSVPRRLGLPRAGADGVLRDHRLHLRLAGLLSRRRACAVAPRGPAGLLVPRGAGRGRARGLPLPDHHPDGRRGRALRVAGLPLESGDGFLARPHRRGATSSSRQQPDLPVAGAP